jgi:hypothetical protein
MGIPEVVAGGGELAEEDETEEGAGAADEGETGLVFVVAGVLADDQESSLSGDGVWGSSEVVGSDPGRAALGVEGAEDAGAKRRQEIRADGSERWNFESSDWYSELR